MQPLRRVIPDRKFTMPIAAGCRIRGQSRFQGGQTVCIDQGVVGDSGLLPLGGATVELQDNTTGMAGNVIRTTTSDAVTGAYAFANVEAGVDYKLVGRTSDGAMQGNVTTGNCMTDRHSTCPLGATSALMLSGTDTYSPRIIKVSPRNNADIAPGAVNVVLTFNEPIRQDAYSIPNPSVLNNIYYDINVSYGGQESGRQLCTHHVVECDFRCADDQSARYRDIFEIHGRSVAAVADQ